MISFSVLDIVFACSFHYIINKLMSCAVCKKILELRTHDLFVFRTSLSIFTVTSNSYLSPSLLSHACTYTLYFHNVCSKFRVKFDRTNGSMPINRNLFTCIYSFFYTMPVDVTIHFVVNIGSPFIIMMITCAGIGAPECFFKIPVFVTYVYSYSPVLFFCSVKMCVTLVYVPY